MGILKRFVEDYKRKKEKYGELKEDYEIQHKVQERMKNANERELERYYEEERQKMIEKQLVHYRKKKSDDMWHSSNLIGKKAKNNFKLGGSIFLK
jgi:hypothetical protein